jgi:thiol-disulfide isomerase/thioredoxin
VQGPLGIRSRRQPFAQVVTRVLVASLMVACACAAATRQTEAADQTSAAGAPIDRVALAAKIRARKAAAIAYHAREQELERRQQAGEPVDAELAAMKRDRPGFSDLKNDALKVIAADPSDEAAFLSIGVVLRATQATPQTATAWPASNDGALHQRLAALLLKYHVRRRDFMDVAGSVGFPNRGSEDTFWTQVFQSSPDREVRGTALWCRLRLRRDELDEFGLPLDKERMLRAEIDHDATELREKYQDVPRLSGFAKDLVDGLRHAPGSVVPDFQVSTLLQGRADSLEQHRGKFLLLDLWATWCTWCIASHRDLAAFSKELGSPRFEILSVNVDKNKQVAVDYVKSHGFPWLDWYLGPGSPVLKALGVQGYPTYLLIDPKGVLVGRTNALTAERKTYIRALLKQPDL